MKLMDDDTDAAESAVSPQPTAVSPNAEKRKLMPPTFRPEQPSAALQQCKFGFLNVMTELN